LFEDNVIIGRVLKQTYKIDSFWLVSSYRGSFFWLLFLLPKKVTKTNNEAYSLDTAQRICLLRGDPLPAGRQAQDDDIVIINKSTQNNQPKNHPTLSLGWFFGFGLGFYSLLALGTSP